MARQKERRRGGDIMFCKSRALGGASAAVLVFAAQAAWAQSAAPAAGDHARNAAAESSTVQELIVTAQKREERINDVAMSVVAATGDKLVQLGIGDTGDLQKIVPGFQSTPTYYGTYVFTIRGV